MFFNEIKDLPKYLKTEVLLMTISLFSLVEIISINVYQKQFFNVYQLFYSNQQLIAITIILYVVGLKFLTPLLRFIGMLIQAIYLEYAPDIIAYDHDKVKKSWEYNRKIREGKKYALMNDNNAIMKLYEKAEKQAKRDEFIGQLSLWNIFLIVALFIDFYSMPSGFTEAPFYYQIYVYIDNAKQTIHQPLLEMTVYISLLAVILKTSSYAWLYFKNEKSFYIPYEEMFIIEDITKSNQKSPQ
jgi:hypothetical protein